MADLNFPKDRTELTPPGTGALQTGDTYTANGTTWVYDATAGAWGSGGGESSSDLFLSKVNDDTAAGRITFEAKTIHKNGAEITTAGVFGKALNDETITDGQNWLAFVAQKSGTTTKTAGVVKGFSASNLTNGSEVYGFHSDILPAAGRYNFYAAGNAPNYFNGSTTFDSGIIAKTTSGTVITSRINQTNAANDAVSYLANAATGAAAKDVVGFLVDSTFRNNLTANEKYGFRSDLNIEGAKPIFNFYAEGSAPNYFAGNVGIKNSSPAVPLDVVGTIRSSDLAGGGNRPVYTTGTGNLTPTSSDARLKTNVVSIGDQTEVVKQMNPVTYNWIDTENMGEQEEIGFIAQEMLPLVPQVVGTNADDTLSIDYSKLVAVLTKALQETIAKNEELEARLAALEGA